MKSLLLTGWFVTRVLFLTLYYPMFWLGTLNVWLKQKWLEA